MRLIPAALLAALLSSCAHNAIQAEALLSSGKVGAELPARAEVGEVPFVSQSRYHCGPATLSMAMHAAGVEASEEILAAQVYTPGSRGTYQMDLIGASRRRGLLALQVHGLENLLREVAAGNPVVVLENLAFRWYPMWHYSLVKGYDLRDPARPLVRMHSGGEADIWVGLRRFERDWGQAGYWGLVVLPPGELSASAGELEHCAAAAALEDLGMRGRAGEAYAAILRRWPSSLGALLGLGNISYARGAFREAAGYLRRATLHHPRSAAAWHNRALAEAAAGMKQRAARSAARAIGIASPEEAEMYRASLSELRPPHKHQVLNLQLPPRMTTEQVNGRN